MLILTKLKVVHLLNTSKYSGAENVVITLIRSLKEEVDCIYVSPRGSISDVLKENNINYYPLDSDIINIYELRKMIKHVKPDIIHAHDFTASILSTVSCFNIPIISHLHNNPLWIRNLNLKSLLYYFSLKRYKKVLAVSKAVVNEFYFSKIIKSKSLVIGNPFDKASVIKKAKEKYDNKFYDLIFIGRLTDQKDPLLLIDIVFELSKKIPEIKVAIIGDGELKLEILKKTQEYRIENNVTIYGFLENPYTVLNNSKILCIPSKWEGFGLVALEAISLGKPVVAASVGGLVNIVDNQCGKLCIKKNDYVEEILNLLLNKKYYDLKSSFALNKSCDFDNIDEYKLQIKEIYANVSGVENDII